MHLRLLSRGIRRPAIDVEGLCSGLRGLTGLLDGGGVFWGDGCLSGRHGVTKVGYRIDGCISTAEERGESGRASGGQKAGRGGAEGGHCGWW